MNDCYGPVSRASMLFDLGDVAVTSHNFEVRPGEAVVVQAQGLLDDDCISIEVVSGCGVGDMFTPYTKGCGCAVKLCADVPRVVVPYPGRYRLRIDQGTPGDYRVSVNQIAADAACCQEASMGCGCNDTPVEIAASLVGDPAAVVLLCDGLKDCLAPDLDANELAALLAGSSSAMSTLCSALSGCIDTRIASPSNALPIATSLAGSLPAVAALCAALTPCIDARFGAPVNAPTMATNLAASPVAVGTLCAALTPCIDARFSAPTNAVPVASILAASLPAVAMLCSALTPCIDARVAAGIGAIPAASFTSSDGSITATTIGTVTNLTVNFCASASALPDLGVLACA